MPKPHFSPYGTRLILGKSSEGKDRVGETFSGLQGGTPCECALRSDCLRPSKLPSPSDPWISHQQKPMPGPRLQAGEWSGDDAPVCRHPLIAHSITAYYYCRWWFSDTHLHKKHLEMQTARPQRPHSQRLCPVTLRWNLGVHDLILMQERQACPLRQSSKESTLGPQGTESLYSLVKIQVLTVQSGLAEAAQC